MRPPAPHLPPPAACPRCGYSLAGAVAAWTQECPFAGLCPECGLTFAWSDLLSPRRSAPRWSPEHRLNHAWRAWLPATLVWLRPWTAWRELRMEHRIRPARLIAYAIALALVAHLITAAASAWLAWDIRVWFNAQVGVPAPKFETLARESALAALWPYGHIDLTPFGLPAIEGMLPLHTTTLGLAVACLIPPLTCLILTDTMRGAKVRPAHLLRAFVGTLPIALLARLAEITFHLLDLDSSRLRGLYSGPAYISLALAWLWLLFAWWCILRRYLRVAQPGLVWLSLALIVTLAALTAMLLADPFALWQFLY